MVNERKEYPIIEFDNDNLGRALRICFQHNSPVTQDDVNWRRWVAQQRISQRLGKEVPLEEIIVRPGIGESYEAITCFRVKHGQPLYIGLKGVHSGDPLALPKLVASLDRYRGENALGRVQAGLVEYAISGLREIVERGEVK